MPAKPEYPIYTPNTPNIHQTLPAVYILIYAYIHVYTAVTQVLHKSEFVLAKDTSSGSNEQCDVYYENFREKNGRERGRSTPLASFLLYHCDVIMNAMASQITGVSIVRSTVCSGADKKKTSKRRVTGLCEGNPPVTGGFPSQRASNAENVSIWWRHHVIIMPPHSHHNTWWCSPGAYGFVELCG